MNSYYYWKKPVYWKEYLLYGGFFFMMEAFQTLQWIGGDVYLRNETTNETNIFGVKHCSASNTNYTFMAHILIWAQPLLFSYIAYRTSFGDYKRFAWYLTIIYVGVLLYSLFSLELGLFTEDDYRIANSIFGPSTCTNQGETGHFVWRFKPHSIDYFPNFFMYIVMCLIAFCLYQTPGTQIIAVSWIVSLVLSMIILRPSSVEVASSWCLLSIIGNMTIFSHLVLDLSTIQFPNVWKTPLPKKSKKLN